MRNKLYKILSKNIKSMNKNDIETISSLIEIHGGTVSDLNDYIKMLELENSKQQGLGVTSSKREETISYQLGKTFIDAANRKTTIKKFSKDLSSLYVESLRRKNKYLNNASLLQKIIILLDDKELQEHYFLDNRKVVGNDLKSEAQLVDIIENVKRYEKEDIAQVTEKSETILNKINIKPINLQEKFLEKKVKVAAIMDEFTSFCFDPEADIYHVTPKNWKIEIIEFRPDILFIESAWKGKDDLWSLKVSQQSEELIELIAFCKQQGIKTIFWSKEDPVHFGTFLGLAKLVDVVFTTDVDCIQKYKNHLDHDDVYLLCFAAQPTIHNPIERYVRQDRFNFAGSYYLKYPIRQRDFAVLSKVAQDYRGLDIFDRNFNKPHPHYEFPESYQPMILGSLLPSEIDKAYKGYTYGINMNTIKQSQTMFARRVFEMLASNTVVISNYSRGVKLLFGDLVICSDEATELTRQLEKFTENLITQKKYKLQGLRKVLSHHTYQHRLKYVLEKAFETSLNINNDHVIVIAHISHHHELNNVLNCFNNQSYLERELFIFSDVELEEVLDKNITIYQTKSELIKAVEQYQENAYIGVFNPNDSYGRYYLTDLVQSHIYLEHESSDPIIATTKDSYFENVDGEAVLKQGKEYQLINSFKLSRSLLAINTFKTEVLGNNKLDRINNLDISSKSFSTDCLGYIADGADLDEDSVNFIHESLVLDEGVDFNNRLLPVSEAIQSNTKEITDYKLISDSSFSHQINKFTQYQDIIDEYIINSNLEAGKHRYISLLNEISIKGSNSIEIRADIKSESNFELVFEYLNINHEKLFFKVVEYNEAITLDNNENASFLNISLRIKGKCSIIINKKVEVNLSIKKDEVTYQDNSTFIFSTNEIDKQLVRPKSKQIVIKKGSDGVVLNSTLPADKFAYIYFRTIYERADINLLLNSQFLVEAVADMDIRSVFVFLDKDKEKLSHHIAPVSHDHAMPIPPNCKYVKVGFKITGSGQSDIESIKIGEAREIVNNLIGKTNTLVLAKQYPSYNDLYKYGFLHSRLRAYKSYNYNVDMFKITNKISELGFREFESIDVFSGEKQQLSNALSSGQFKNLFIHILDTSMWNVVINFIDKLNICIWIHGSEAQTWQSRQYELEGLSDQEVSHKKKLSDNRKAFWQLLIKNFGKKVTLIFVSKYSKQEFIENICNGKEEFNSKTIHNFIDSNIFPYDEKESSSRYKVLSVRPFSSKTYANDLTVKTILELSKYPKFNQMSFTIVGDGILFGELTKPIAHFDNVELQQKFVNQNEISVLHKDHGIFLVPTRMDSQGVSRGEAMSSGLVPVTNTVAAIPEFVDSSSGVLVNGEDYISMAARIIDLIDDPNEFLLLSKSASERVQLQCSFENTIAKETKLIN